MKRLGSLFLLLAGLLDAQSTTGSLSGVVLDPAAASLLDCYSEPATSDLIAQDLVDVVGLDRDAARRAAATTTHLLRNAGVIVATNQEAAQSWRYHYPPSASP